MHRSVGRTPLHRQNGFTLVELVIVMAVIALILSVVIPNLRGMQQEGLMTQVDAQLQTLRSAVSSYAQSHGNQFPNDINHTLTQAKPQIIAGELRDPWTTNADGITYGYTSAKDPSFGAYYILWTQGPSHDTSPAFAGGQVTYTGSGRVVSNAPVVRH